MENESDLDDAVPIARYASDPPVPAVRHPSEIGCIEHTFVGLRDAHAICTKCGAESKAKFLAFSVPDGDKNNNHSHVIQSCRRTQSKISLPSSLGELRHEFSHYVVFRATEIFNSVLAKKLFRGATRKATMVVCLHQAAGEQYSANSFPLADILEDLGVPDALFNKIRKQVIELTHGNFRCRKNDLLGSFEEHLEILKPTLPQRGSLLEFFVQVRHAILVPGQNSTVFARNRTISCAIICSWIKKYHEKIGMKLFDTKGIEKQMKITPGTLSKAVKDLQPIVCDFTISDCTEG